MKVTLIQTELFWEDAKRNREHFSKLIENMKEKTDIIVLPEMFSTGFSMNPKKVAEASNGEGLKWMQEQAKLKQAVVTGSMAVEENGQFYNRLFWVEPNGNYQTYDKRHLFRMAKEDSFYTAGTQKIITQINGWRVCPLICYDLRFPVWSRNRFQKAAGIGQETVGTGQSAIGVWDYDVLIYVANWPEVRSYPWKQLLIARAIENQCYVIGVNRIGNDGNGFGHSGDSLVLNPRGETISNIKANEETIQTIELDKYYLEEFRKNFPVGLDADGFHLS